jgi:hypothetical protein
MTSQSTPKESNDMPDRCDVCGKPSENLTPVNSLEELEKTRPVERACGECQQALAVSGDDDELAELSVALGGGMLLIR